MSGQMFAAYLCSTQVSGKINPDGGPIERTSPTLRGVNHGGGYRAANENYPTVRLLLFTHDKQRSVLDIDQRHIVTVEDPS